MPRAENTQPFRCRRFRSRDSSCRPQYAHNAGGSRSAEILCQADFIARDLALARLAADLQRYIANLPHAGGAHRMAFGLEPAAGVDREFAVEAGLACQCVRAAFTLLDEAEIFGC